MSGGPCLVPATCVALAVDQDGPLCAIALLGPPGAGKSQTALSLLTACPYRRSRLISDDMTRLTQAEGRIWAAPAPGIEGAVELHGTGISLVSIEERQPLSFAFRLGLGAERQPAAGTRWGPFGAAGQSLPEYRWVAGRAGMICFLRAVLSGHSSRAGFDSIPVNRGEEKSP